MTSLARELRDVYSELDEFDVAWDDFEEAGRATRALATRLGTDRRALRALVYGVEQRPELLAKCERHQLLDYIVLYDALDRGFRVRIHMSTNDHLERPHDHRFSFSSYIVRGMYRHTLHELSRPAYKDPSAAVSSFMSIQAPDPHGRVTDVDIRTINSREETAGCSYTLHHTAVHTTVTTPHTISVFVRGPSEKDRSLIYDAASRSYWWRFGSADEPPERRRQKTMSKDDYTALRDHLETLSVI